MAKKQKSKFRKIFEGVILGVFVALIGVSCFTLISSNVNKKKSGNEYAPTLVGNSYVPLIVLTDSMEPDIKTGSAIFVKRVECEDIIQDFQNDEIVDLCFDDTYAKYANLSTDYTQETKDFLISYTVDGELHQKTNRTTESNPAPIRTLTHRLFYIQINENIEYGSGKYLFFVEGINVKSNNYAGTNQYQVFSENELYGRVIGSSKFVGGLFSFVKSPLGLIILLLVPSLYMVISSILDLFRKYDGDEESNSAVPADLNGLSQKDIERLKKEMLNEIINGKEEKEWEHVIEQQDSLHISSYLLR